MTQFAPLALLAALAMATACTSAGGAAGPSVADAQGAADADLSAHGATVPEPYTSMQNPYGYADPSLANLGAGLYTQHCNHCHGSQGSGDGTRAKGRIPVVSDLNAANLEHQDNYWFWRIHQGGKAFQSAMPAFAEVLTDDEIWRIITYCHWHFSNF